MSSAHHEIKTVVCVVGTRPEAIKMAPVFSALTHEAGIRPLLVLTGQHREQLIQALKCFNLPVSVNLDIMTENQSTTTLASRLLPEIAAQFSRCRADYVLVHGDTTTTFAAAWAAFLGQIPVGHVEAGLRSHNLCEPFPEEANRRLTDVISDLYLAPTALARENLEQEGVSPGKIVVTGQTGIDSIFVAAQKGRLPSCLGSGPFIAITIHRRENIPILADIASVLCKIARAHRTKKFVFPVHFNPQVREVIWPMLSREENMRLLDPLEYSEMASLLAQSDLLITDSGGLQEEAVALNVRTVVVRNVTERPEGIKNGILRLGGTDTDVLFDVINESIIRTPLEVCITPHSTPYGDGQAAFRVARSVSARVFGRPMPSDWRAS